MRTPFSLLSCTLLPLVLAACAAGPAPTTEPTWLPTPIGETAMPVAATPPAAAIAITHPVEIEHAWTDANGRRWNIAYRCRITSDDAHETLAAACLQANWATAIEQSLPICAQANLDTIPGIVACEQQLQQRLTDVLFPCAADTFVGAVTGIEWTLWRVQ